MPPKATVAVDSLDAASVKFILSALKSCSEFAPNWTEVAKEHDIKYAKNARPRFNTIVAKFGFKLEDKKIVQFDKDGIEEAEGAAVTPKKTAKSKKPKTPASNKKRKVEEEAEEDDEEVNQAKQESEGGADVDGTGGSEIV